MTILGSLAKYFQSINFIIWRAHRQKNQQSHNIEYRAGSSGYQTITQIALKNSGKPRATEHEAFGIFLTNRDHDRMNF